MIKALAIIGVLAFAQDLAAQVCNGTASFASGPLRVGAGATTGLGSEKVGLDATKSTGLNATMGRAEGAWAGVYLDRLTFDYPVSTGISYGATAGYSHRSMNREFEICPQASFGVLRGPDFGSGIFRTRTNGFSGTLGLSVGRIIRPTKAFDFIPSGMLLVSRSNVKARSDSEESSATDWSTRLGLGGGLVFNKSITVRPGVAMALNAPNRAPIYTLGISFNLGARQVIE